MRSRVEWGCHPTSRLWGMVAQPFARGSAMEPKPGFKSSEFWLALTVVMIQFGLPLFLLLKTPFYSEAGAWELALVTLLSAVAVSVPTAAYSYSRSRVKTAYALRRAVRRRPGPGERPRFVRGRVTHPPTPSQSGRGSLDL